MLMIVGGYVEDYEVMVPFQALQMVINIPREIYEINLSKKFGKQTSHVFDILNATKKNVSPVNILTRTIADVGECA